MHKRLQRLFILLPGFLLLSSCSSLWFTTSHAIRKAELTNSPVNDTVETKNVLGLYVVYVKVNDNPEVLEMVFDTGANLTVLSAKAVRRLNLEPQGSLSLGDSKGQSRRVPLLNIDKLQLGEGIYTDVLAAVIDFPDNSSITCIARDGILGYHVIRQLNWAIHPGDTLLVGSVDDLRGDRSYDEVEMRGWKAPMLAIEYGLVRYGNILFDSGATGDLDLEYNDIRYTIDSIPMIANIDGTSQGVYGPRLDTLFQVADASVTLGNTRMQADIEYSPGEDRKIGMGTLGRYHLIISGRNQRLYIGEEEVAFTRRRTFGMIPGLQDTTLFVSSIEPEGQAANEGLQLHQRIVSVNGISGSEIANQDCGYLNFLMGLRESDQPLVIETADGTLVQIEKHIPEPRLYKIIETDQ